MGKKKIIGAIIEEEKNQSLSYKVKWTLILLISIPLCAAIIGIPILIYSWKKLKKKQTIERIVNAEA